MNPDKLWTKDFILLGLANLFMSIGFYFLMPTLPIYVVDKLQANKGEVGYVLAAYTLSALIIRPFTGYVIDRAGRKWIFIISFLLFAGTLGLYPLASTFMLLIFLRFFHGFLWGMTGTSGATLIVDVIPPARRGQGIGIYGLSMTIAMAVGPVLALIIMGKDHYNLMFFSSMFVALAGFMILIFVRYPPFESKNKDSFNIRNILETKTIPMALIQLLFGATYGGVVSFITLYAKEIGIQQASPFFFIFAAGIFISRLWSGKIFDRRGPQYLVIGGIFLLIIGFFILALVKNIGGYYSSAFFIGLGTGIMMPTLMAMANNVVDKTRRGAANATVITAFDLGIGLGSILLGFLSERITLGYTYLSCTLILAVAFLYFIWKGYSFYEKHLIKG
ncbi:MAG: MFS transporter [Deltaproteobacteria bacterium]|nr:MFS transporter [Deltaproteobacteria bacterium]